MTHRGKAGGESVAPVEIEAALKDHPAVEEIAVVGVPDEEWGEVGRAHIVLRQGASLEPEELADRASNPARRIRAANEGEAYESPRRTSVRAAAATASAVIPKCL